MGGLIMQCVCWGQATHPQALVPEIADPTSLRPTWYERTNKPVRFFSVSSHCYEEIVEDIACGDPEFAPLSDSAGWQVQTYQPLPHSLQEGLTFWHFRAHGRDWNEGEIPVVWGDPASINLCGPAWPGFPRSWTLPVGCRYVPTVAHFLKTLWLSCSLAASHPVLCLSVLCSPWLMCGRCTLWYRDTIMGNMY